MPLTSGEHIPRRQRLNLAGEPRRHTPSFVERGWWPGPDTCTSSDITNLSTEDLMTRIMNAPLVRCDEVQWDLLGLSMASWNAVISLGLAGLWLAAAVWAPNPYDSSSASQ